jgi:hypothetical protein
LLVIDPKRNAIVVPEVEFAQVAMQVAFIAVLIDATHASLEQSKIALDGIR